MNNEMYKSAAADKIMQGMPGSNNRLSNLSPKLTASVQAFNDDAQISLINMHITKGMSVENRRRAERVKAGTYRGKL